MLLIESICLGERPASAYIIKEGVTGELGDVIRRVTHYSFRAMESRDFLLPPGGLSIRRYCLETIVNEVNFDGLK